MNKTQEEFLKDLTPSESEFGMKPTEEVADIKSKGADEDEDEGRKNRRERRLEAKLQAERESSIALAARLDALTEAQKFRQETEPSEYEKKIDRIYGNQTPEAIEATNILREALKGVHTKATEDALAAFREEQQKTSQAIAQEEQSLNGMVEEIEDEYGVTFDKNTSTAFFSLLEKLSPKDKDGNIKEYADHRAVWEELQERKKRTGDNRAKDLASRSMARSGASPDTNIQEDVNWRYLKSIGW